MSVAARLSELGITLPEPAKAVANYVPFVRTGNHVHISGQLSNDASGGIKGTVGVDVTVEQGVDCAMGRVRDPEGAWLTAPAGDPVFAAVCKGG